ncbi:MAG: dephospho-CoA kinase, partial [Candidatus Diapherotrites archaeon]|nr:dephospho-CoA kinase [Candidatus Diapherotrites archaeon]
MVLVIVTGGFGSGKTTVTRAFKSRGCVVFDSDKIVEELYKKNEVQKKLAKEFGAEVIARGKVDRSALARKVFSDKPMLKKLDQIVHPLVFSQIRKKVKKIPSKKIVAVEVPLFFESPLARPLYPDFV